MTEMHCHILPGIDDGSDSTETSREMLEMMRGQGVDRIYATPHFYAHREKGVERFLEKRQEAFEKLDEKDILLGAEIAIEHGISELPGIEKLAYQGTDLILLEFQYDKYASWMETEIFNIASEYKLTPVIAHIHRYIQFFTKEQMEHILGFPAIFQINNEAFFSWSQARFVKKLISYDLPLIFGSDAHNLKTRKPNWDLVAKSRRKAELLEQAESIIEKHTVQSETTI